MAAKDVSLRRALTTTTVASVGPALFLMCGAFVVYELVTFRATMVRTLSAQAAIVGRQSTSALVFHDPESAAATLGALREEPHVVSAGIYGGDGTLFASYVRDGLEASAVPRPRAAGAQGHSFEPHRLVLFRPIVFDDAPIGSVVIESDLEEMRTRLQRYALIVLSVLAASFVLAYGTASRLQRRIIGPVRALVQTAQAVSDRQDYSVRVAEEARGELGQLVRAFNHMLDQIQERDVALQGVRGELEGQVDERTKDLQKEVAERKALGEELHEKNRELEGQSRRVQEATRLKSEFLANMSHELRTPLNAIVGFAELLHDGKIGPVSPDQKESLADILTSSQHLLQLINDILDLSKVEAGKMEFRPERVDVRKLFVEVRDIVRGMSAQKRIAVTMDLEEGLGEVTVDPGKLKQVLYNYLSNALKFTPEGGRVVLRARAEGPDRFRVEVEDSGIGVKAEDVSRLFVEFQQLDTGTAKAHAGTGLGLALTKRIVEAQGGSVGVRSTLGQGSLFLAAFPRVTAGSKSTASPPTRSPLPDLATILVVDDDAVDRAWLGEALSQGGYAVEVATTGREALDRCRARAFEGIALDLLLPDMTGWDVLREVRAGGPNRNTPVIVTTVVAERGVGAGFAIHDYLVKPLQAEQLLDSLKRAGVQAPTDRPVLVVDDDPHARRLVETTLQGLGYRSVAAASGEEAIRAVGKEPPAAVILDLIMPEMDGFEFLERFRTLPSGRATPVIVWTAKDLTAEDYRRLGPSAHGVVLKREGGAGPLIQELRLHVTRPAGGG